jgi:thioredoxin 1
MSYRAYKDLGHSPEELQNVNLRAVEVIKTTDQKKQILSQNKIVVIDVFGEWCGPCKAVKPIFAKYAEQYNRPGVIYLCSEDVDAGCSPDCTAVPMFQFYHNGQRVKSVLGADMKQVQQSIEAILTATTTSS